jgi:hypothetical protein
MPESRYHIENEDLRKACLALQIGQGVADRYQSVDGLEFIVKAEDWADMMVAEFIMTPLKPSRAPGQSKADFAAALSNNSLFTRRNFPVQFIEAIIYRALELFLASEFFENQPNRSESSKWAAEQAQGLIAAFKDMVCVRVGAGRKRNPNPFIPPTIAPRQSPPPRN